MTDCFSVVIVLPETIMRLSERRKEASMKIAGIIAEYNPFHRGHEYHLSEARRAAGADFCVAVMSGCLVQRGEPAIADKYTRAKMALLSGADLVIELPAPFSSAAAPDFALGGVRLLSALGADYLCFGSETADLPRLERIAEALVHEPEAISERIQSLQKSGLSYAAGMTAVIAEFFSPSGSCGQGCFPEDADRQSCTGSLGSNDLLALEYLKAIRKTGSGLTPAAIRREGSPYNTPESADVCPKAGGDEAGRVPRQAFASAGFLRGRILNGDFSALTPQIPPSALNVLLEAFSHYRPVRADDFSDFIWYALQNADPESFAGCSAELALRLKKKAPDPFTFSGITEALRGKNISASTVRRALIHLASGLTEEDAELFRSDSSSLYARILGFRRSSQPLLQHLKKTASIPLVTKTADAESLLPSSALKLFSCEKKAAALYRQAVYRRSGFVLPDEYRAGIIIV